jgi:hypothetical protein
MAPSPKNPAKFGLDRHRPAGGANPQVGPIPFVRSVEEGYYVDLSARPRHLAFIDLSLSNGNQMKRWATQKYRFLSASAVSDSPTLDLGQLLLNIPCNALMGCFCFLAFFLDEILTYIWREAIGCMYESVNKTHFRRFVLSFIS